MLHLNRLNNSASLIRLLIEVSKGVAGIKIPVTAKIRVFEDIGKTVEYAKMIESTGVAVKLIWNFFYSVFNLSKITFFF